MWYNTLKQTALGLTTYGRFFIYLKKGHTMRSISQIDTLTIKAQETAWDVDITYTDKKTVNFQIDYGNEKEDMLTLLEESIFLQHSTDVL